MDRGTESEMRGWGLDDKGGGGVPPSSGGQLYSAPANG